MVRMGELAISAAPADTLVSIGLGSCIGLALLDRRRGVAGLAHIVLPAAPEAEPPSPKYADTAVPLLVDRLMRLGALRFSLEAVLVGGAEMFSFANARGNLDVGQRNEQATLEALARHGVSVRASATRGNKGRTIRVHVGSGLVTVREAGGTEIELVSPAYARAAGGVPS
jgi:chemotaxis protein CheD